MIPVSYNVRNLIVRKTTTLAAALGLGLVVAVFAGAMMLTNGIKKTLGRGASPDVAVVLRKGATTELESVIEEQQINLVLNDTVLTSSSAGAGDRPRGVAEIMVVVLLDKLGTSGVSNVQIRGVPPDAHKFRGSSTTGTNGSPPWRIVAGRLPQPGADEVMIGKAIRGRFKGLDIDQTFELKRNRPVRVVGVFEDQGSSYESEVWADTNIVRTAFRREGYVSSIRVRLEPNKFDAFKTSIESSRQFAMQVLREEQYYEKQSEGISIFITALSAVIVVFFSLGAMIGAMITMHAAVANRQREIGTLRALGFSRVSILACFLLEAILLSLFGGAVGLAAAMLLSTYHPMMMNFASWSEVVFTFEPTPKILVTSLVFASAMGLLGGVFPAVRASRVSPIEAMRA